MIVLMDSNRIHSTLCDICAQSKLTLCGFGVE